MAPRSRGSIRLNPKNPAIPRRRRSSTPSTSLIPRGRSWRRSATPCTSAAQLGAQPALAALLEGELKPGPTVSYSRGDLRAWILANATHDYHPAGTCRMGPASDPTAVVDASGRVHGLENVLVADASIMPFVTLANTNLPTFVGAEKIARDLMNAP